MKILSIRNGFIEIELRKLNIDVQSHAYKYIPQNVDSLIAKMDSIKPDIFFFWKDPNLFKDVLQKCKAASPNTKFVMWWGDQRGNKVIPDLIKQRKGLLDALFMTNEDPDQIEMFTKFGIPQIRTFYHSFPENEFQEFPTKPTHQVFFGGNRFKTNHFPLCQFRAKLVTEIQSKFSLLLYGGGWSFPSEKPVLRPEYAKVLRMAHINLGVNHYNIVRYYNRRLFECVASGRLHLTYYIPGMEKHFVQKKHLVWFHTIPQALKLIEYYLNNKEEREQIAKTGREFFFKHHSWPTRAKELLTLFESL